MKVQKYKQDEPWQALARTHQSDYREYIGLEAVSNPPSKTVCYGNILSDKDAANGVIYFDEFRDIILDDENSRKGNIAKNLLRSEHIPYNLFFPMKLNLDAVKELLLSITNRDVAEVTKLEIEYAPKPIDQYLNDHTVFDTYIEYLNFKGEPCGIGIEVKYTEQSYNIGKTEKEQIFEGCSSRYFTVTRESGCYETNGMNSIDFVRRVLAKDSYRQIWRNQMLGESMVQHGDLKDFLSIHLFPAFNEHFQEVLPRYTKLLTHRGKLQFMPLTFEQLFAAMKSVRFTDCDKEWIDYLYHRYLYLGCYR